MEPAVRWRRSHHDRLSKAKKNTCAVGQITGIISSSQKLKLSPRRETGRGLFDSRFFESDGGRGAHQSPDASVGRIPAASLGMLGAEENGDDTCQESFC
jgi:hypothetical protein